MTTRSEIRALLLLQPPQPLKGVVDPQALKLLWTLEPEREELLNLGECGSEEFDRFAGHFLKLTEETIDHSWPPFWRQLAIQQILRLTPIYYIPDGG